MKSRNTSAIRSSGGTRPDLRRTPKETRGAALIITLLLLALLSAASLAMVLLVSSDSMINGYYRNYRGSFYAADSGANAVVEAIKNAINTSATPTTNPPIAGIPAGVVTAYAQFEGGYFSFGDPNSWASQFKLLSPFGQTILGAPTSTYAANDPNACALITDTTCNGHVNDNDYQWTITYPFTVTVQGQSSGVENEEITETGKIIYESVSGTASSAGPPSFSKWGAFITNFASCQGPLVPGTMTGPFFTDGQWNFGNFSSPGYTFTDPVGQSGADVSWWNGGCTNATSAPRGINKPNFEGGLQLSQTAVVPPSDSYNQVQAVLNGAGLPPCTATPCAADPAPSQAQMSAELKTVSGTAYPPSGTAPQGVYVPYYTSNGQNFFGTAGGGAAGGFYINGNAGVTLSATGTSTDPTQTYTITQTTTTGSGWSRTTTTTTTTIVVNPSSGSAGTTTVTSGGTTLTLTGIPEQLDPNSGAAITQLDPSGNPVNPTLVYVNGDLTSLSGTVQNDMGITMTASTGVSITGDLTYASAPVTIPADTLISNSNAGVLGVYTTGNISLYPDSRGNLTVDASLAALSGNTGSSATSGFETPGGSIGTWTIVGGRAEDQAHGVSISQGNTYYDRRFANNFGPPWFPTAVPQAGTAAVPSSSQVSVIRTSWADVNRQ